MNRFKKIRRWVILAAILGVLAVSSLVSADIACRSAASGKIFRSTETIPANNVALVLGTAMAAAAVAGAWRPVARETADEAGPDDLSREDPRRRLNSGAGAPSRPSPRPVR